MSKHSPGTLPDDQGTVLGQARKNQTKYEKCQKSDPKVGYLVPGSWVVGYLVPGSRVVGYLVPGSRVVGYLVPGSRVVGYLVPGSRVLGSFFFFAF